MSNLLPFIVGGIPIKNIQRGVTLMNNVDSTAVAITAVDMSKSTLKLLQHKQVNVDFDYTPLGYINTSTELVFETINSTVNGVYVSWEVIEYV